MGAPHRVLPPPTAMCMGTSTLLQHRGQRQASPLIACRAATAAGGDSACPALVLPGKQGALRAWGEQPLLHDPAHQAQDSPAVLLTWLQPAQVRVQLALSGGSHVPGETSPLCPPQRSKAQPWCCHRTVTQTVLPMAGAGKSLLPRPGSSLDSVTKRRGAQAWETPSTLPPGPTRKHCKDKAEMSRTRPHRDREDTGGQGKVNSRATFHRGLTLTLQTI